ncbi:hypothetical protein [Deinococcus daejeonensis]|uniref:Uncharacterized protein n=1 Tax=Deinococcus daejeonensis TaxID=1007098 RepID=A0ABQ2IQP2_9DEIO|nr:hypothetical protein [Deinococcus daejeonensis]GGN27421.1 hypothetical protein GCM10010842_00340 [Deinococcus daejeonensis]
MSGTPTVPTGYSSSTDLIVSYGPAFPWQVFAVACALLFLAFLFRRLPWARWALTGAGALALIVAGVLWAGMA